MAYDQLLSGGWRLIRRHKFLLWLGVLVVIWGRLGEVGLRLGLPEGISLRQDFLARDVVFPASRTLFLWTAALLAFVLLTWMAGMVAEGGLMTTAAQPNQDTDYNLRQALGAGWRVLGRLVAVDTLLFLPLFCLCLLLLLLPTGVLVAGALRLEGGAPAAELLALLGVGLVATLLLVGLAIPVLLLTLILRLLAFRAIAVTDLGVRAAVRRAVGLLRQRWGPVLLIGVLLTGLRYGTAVLLALLFGLVAVGVGGGAGFVLVGALFGTIVHALVHAFSSTVWTLAYRQFDDAQALSECKDRRIVFKRVDTDANRG